MNEESVLHDRLPNWLLLLGPFLVLGALLAGVYLTSPFGDIEEMADAGMLTILWMLTYIGAIAGIVPVLIGMLWYPYLRRLGDVWIHAVLALSVGVLTFAGVEMTEGILDNAAEAANPFGEALGIAGVPITGLIVGILGTGVAFGVLMYVSRWRYNKISADGNISGIHVAYLVAIGLGLHSIGEGLAIGTAFIQGEERLVMLLVIAFLLDNITEGPTIVAAVASDTEQPPLSKFLLMGAIAGGPVIIGGWIGGFAESALLAALFFGLGLGAIIQVIYEVLKFIGVQKGSSVRAAITQMNIIAFVVGFLIMVVIDEIIIEMFLL